MGASSSKHIESPNNASAGRGHEAMNHESKTGGTGAQPPSYHLVAMELQFPTVDGIESFSVPQWTWSTAQSRTWVYVTLVEKYEFTPKRAAATASKFVGAGPELYSCSYKDWQDRTGDLVVGISIRNFIHSHRKAKGAVPSGTRFLHWEERRSGESGDGARAGGEVKLKVLKVR
jgi:hypothetical protein